MGLTNEVDLDDGKAGVGERLDERDLRVGRHVGGFVLQAVARADLHDAHPGRSVS